MLKAKQTVNNKEKYTHINVFQLTESVHFKNITLYVKFDYCFILYILSS